MSAAFGLDQTVFYPIGGGQPGDTGVLRLATGQSIPIVDTIKGGAPDEVVHIPAPGSTLPDPGTELVAEIDWERRYRLTRSTRPASRIRRGRR